MVDDYIRSPTSPLPVRPRISAPPMVRALKQHRISVVSNTTVPPPGLEARFAGAGDLKGPLPRQRLPPMIVARKGDSKGKFSSPIEIACLNASFILLGGLSHG